MGRRDKVSALGPNGQHTQILLLARLYVHFARLAGANSSPDPLKGKA